MVGCKKIQIIICLVLVLSLRNSFAKKNKHRFPNSPFNQIGSIRRNTTLRTFAGNIEFRYYDKDGNLLTATYLGDSESYYDEINSVCSPDEKFALVTHGWKESCDQTWMKVLIKKLKKYRGGCVICMDYRFYSQNDYTRLVRQFTEISTILTTKLIELEWLGFIPDNGYLFGFSFGAQLSSLAGRNFGARKLKECDLCEIAGPGFDYRSQPDHRLAAQNVQCIHTSSDKGTRFSNCDQNWKLGNCGQTQIAASAPPLGSHGLCPYFYNSAFKHDFYAIEQPRDCKSKRPALNWPKGFKMGYMEDRKRQVNGDLFAETTASYPYTPHKTTRTDELEHDVHDYENITSISECDIRI